MEHDGDRIVGILHGGQSLAVAGGARSLPRGRRAVSIEAPEPRHALSLGGRMFRDGIAPLEEAELGSFRPAREDAALGESQGTAILRHLVRAARAGGEKPPVLAYRSVGAGGMAIAGLGPGTAPYANLLMAGRAMDRLAREEGRPGAWFPASPWSQGEADRSRPRTPRRTYRDALLEYAAGIDADLRGISGQAERIWITVDQLSAPNAAAEDGRIPFAQLDAMEAATQRVALVAPKYMLRGEYGFFWDPGPPEIWDNVHLQPRGYALLGEYHAKAIRRIMTAQAADPEARDVATCLRPDRRHISRTGDRITLPLLGAVGEVVLDTLALPPAPGHGFAHPAGVVSVEVAAGALHITLDGKATGRLTYGVGAMGGTPREGRAGAWGNVRDSDPTPSEAVPGLALRNWLVLHDVEGI